MSVVPERIHEFYEPPKPQVGTVLPRYAIQSGYLVLDEFRTRDLPRPPPVGWDSAQRLGLVIVATLVTFVGVVAIVLVSRGTRSYDDTSSVVMLARANDTNGTTTTSKLYVAMETEDDTVQESVVMSTAFPRSSTVSVR